MAKYANLSADEIRGHRMLVFRRTVAYIVLDIGMYYLYLSVCYARGKYNKRYIDIKNDI